MFLHRPISSALIISAPPWPVLGSVQDTSWRAHSKAKGRHLPIQISLALLTPVKCKILSLPCEQHDALTTAQWQEWRFTLRLLQGELLCLMERDSPARADAGGGASEGSESRGRALAREEGLCSPAAPTRAVFPQGASPWLHPFSESAGGTALLSQ